MRRRLHFDFRRRGRFLLGFFVPSGGLLDGVDDGVLDVLDGVFDGLDGVLDGLGGGGLDWFGGVWWCEGEVE